MWFPTTHEEVLIVTAETVIFGKVKYLDSTVVQFPWHTSCLNPSGFGLSQYSRWPEATSPAIDTLHGGCPPGTELDITQQRRCCVCRLSE